MTIGGYDLDSFANGQPLTWLTLSEDAYYWQFELKMLSYTIDGVTSKTGSGTQVIFDCGTSINLMPLAERNKFKTTLERSLGTKCSEESQVLACQCSDDNLSSFPDLKFNIGGNDFILPRDTYVSKSFRKEFGTGPEYNLTDGHNNFR